MSPTSREAGPAPLVRAAQEWMRAVQRSAAQAGIWMARVVARRALSRLDGRHLGEIGFDGGWVRREAAKPFWSA
ncbi:MAG: hypothetical protein U1F33_12730 [Alphaproteobacteria bacterium]